MEKEFKSLSELIVSIDDKEGITHFVAYAEDIKEFIKIILEDYNKRIDKIQQSFKNTNDPIIVTERFNLMKILCGFVDEVNERAGGELI